MAASSFGEHPDRALPGGRRVWGVHLWDDIESWNVTADGGVGPFTPPDEIDRPAPHPRARVTVMKGTH